MLPWLYGQTSLPRADEEAAGSLEEAQHCGCCDPVRSAKALRCEET